LWRAETGTVRVFGLDPVADPVSVLGRIGYLSEQPDLPDWMRVNEFLRYTQAFYPKWDAAYAEKLLQLFGLDPASRVRVLSKGQRAKLGLLAAQAHRPDLLLLDEPSSGLDPIVRKDILAAVIHTVSSEGRTVLFSSHLLEEIDRVSDHIAMLHQGRLVLCGALDEVKAQHRRITMRFENKPLAQPIVPGALSVETTGKECVIICNGSRMQVQTAVVELGARIVDDDEASLNEIFMAHAGERLEQVHA
jgi:ABC-2 type transport system ATP-binding protein